jgi:hypothetical protein
MSWPAGLSWALKLASLGLPSFPCAENKRPTTPNGFKDATRDPEGLRRLWRQHPGQLVGVPTGEASGLDVLDIDPRHGGDVWFRHHKGQLPSTRVHGTRSGGLHFLFRHKPNLRCSVGRVARGVDVRADGGYVIWWPAAGFQFLQMGPVAPWPNWLLPPLCSPPPRKRLVVPDRHALAHLTQFIASGQAGQRNSLTFWAACRVGEMVASGLLRADVAAALITDAAMRGGLSQAEAERTAWNGIRAAGGSAHA